ncbi:MAG TPA: hypothetical protein VMI92_12830 [Steroidobacteraceae bacterium]|nr:hypothetical protein [Steroidobacteraceae bacterium]
MQRLNSIDDLESAVLARIAAHRVAQADPDPTRSLGPLMVAVALVTGLTLGWVNARTAKPAAASESVLVSSDTELPSNLLASN